MNLMIRQFEQKLINAINEEPLPIELKRLVLKDILEQVETESNKAIQRELTEQNRKTESEESEDGN